MKMRNGISYEYDGMHIKGIESETQISETNLIYSI
jgi:hypothetical protein